MRRYILFIALCLHIAARGQTVPEGFDLSWLPQPTQAKALRYWIDDDIGSLQTTNILNGQHMVDVSSLHDGLHTIHYQIIDSEDKVAAPYSRIFLKMNERTDISSTAATLRYWFDDDTNVSVCDANMGTQVLDVSTLFDGLHTLHYQVVDTESKVSYIASAIFLKMETTQESSNVTPERLIYWFDDEGSTTSVDMMSGVMSLDASNLSDGLHTIHYLVLCSDGSVTSAYSSIFLRMNIDIISTTAQSLRYWFDDETDVNTISVASGTQTLDVSDLLAGLHTLHYQIVDSNGQLTSTYSSIFLKMFDKLVEDGQNGITKYQYWLNDNTTAVQTETFDEAINPYSLIALLPVQQEPIRSFCFHFENKDSKPMMYAKNDFYIRFHDAANYWKDESRQFIDYSISREVKPVGELQAKQSFEKVAENDVRWYTMQVAPGDTAAFRLSQPATLQLFAPSGQEVFKTSESASVRWNGIHTWEDGTYYLAVHDVTGSQGDMTLEYMHMDKYDVVDWDVHTVGNGGCSTITFKGNGFRDLYAVDLVIAPNDTVHSVAVSHDSDAETAVTFDFTGATLGEYNAVFHFTEEDKYFANVVTVEEAVDIELSTDVSFPSSFLSGTSTTYTIRITNKGNMTAYRVPIYTWLKTKSQDGISHVEYEGLELAGLFDNIETDSLSSSDIANIKVHSVAAGDDHYFLKFWAKDEGNSIDSFFVRSNYFFTNIAPFETKTLRLTVSSKEEIFSYFTVPKGWPSFDTIGVPEGVNARARFKAPSLKDQYCCIKSRVECVASITADVVGIANKVSDIWAPGTPADIALGVASCLADALNQLVSATGTVMCDDDSNVEDKLWEKVKAISNGLSIANTLSGCASKLLPAGKLKTLLDAINKISEGEGWLTGLGIGIDFEGCKEAFSTPIPGCPPDNDGGGGSSTPYTPRDPNEIYGYLSEAGSKFIADSVARVNYTIEFENDTTLANASAHTIVITDTLDSKYFDLTKFMPTGVRIGGHEVFLDEVDVVTNNNKTSFVKTIDMRPEINAIAQVDGEYNQKKGIAEWRFTSLDPMTMEPTNDLMQGILPVNYDGTSGIGEVMFEIGVKSGKNDGTEIKNRAGIVFDYEEAILTPTWTNIVDAEAPSSFIDDFEVVNDTILRIYVDGFDNRSGIWKYELHAQYGENAPWWKISESDSTSFDFRFYDDIDYGFCVLATDSAGNMEKKVIQREFIFKAHEGDYEDTIEEIPATAIETEDAYDVSGRKVGRKAKGIIIRHSDGTTRKVLIKE